MIDFIYKSSLSLFVLLVIYHLVLERQKMHKFNRFYLLFSLVFSLVLPFVTIKIARESTVSVQQTYKYLAQNIQIQNQAVVVQSFDYTSLILGCLYVLITLLLIFRFINNLLKIYSKIKNGNRMVYKNASLVLVDEQIAPHTFLSYIFLNKTDYHNQKIEEQLYSHELIHVTQKHTWDVLFIEALKTIFWFNPLFLFYKKAIQLNHEFLADENVVTSFNDVPFYQNLLLLHANTNSISGLTSNLNYSVTKKRFIMMTKTVSKTKVLLSKIVLLLLFSILFFFICIEGVGQNSSNSNVINGDNFIITNEPNSGFIVTSRRKEILATKEPEIMMSIAYSLQETKVNQPALQNAMEKISNYITNNYVSPKGIDKKEEVATIKFFLNNDGTITDIITSSKGTVTEAEILRILKSSPKFLPDESYGKADWKPIDIIMDFWPVKSEEIKKEATPASPPVPAITSTDIIVDPIDKKPEFPGGALEFYKFIGKNFKMPAEASKNKIQGKVYIEFMVEKDGSLSEFKIVKDLGYGIGDEVIQALKLSPTWTPGSENGKPVRVLYRLPVTIENNETPKKDKVINASFNKVDIKPTIFGN